MGDLGDVFNMLFDNDGDDSQSQKKTGSQDGASKATVGSVVMAKLTRNRRLLAATVVAGIAVLGVGAFVMIKYIEGIIDGIKPFLN